MDSDFNDEDRSSREPSPDSSLFMPKIDLVGEIAKAKAVQGQLALWEQLLAVRIRMQRALLNVNQLPQNEPSWNAFLSKLEPADLSQFSDTKRRSKIVLDSLLSIQNDFWHQNNATKNLVSEKSPNFSSGVADEDNEEILSSASELDEENYDKEKKDDKTEYKSVKFVDYPAVLDRRIKAFNGYRDKTLLQWYEKTKLSTGKSGGKNDFLAFEKNILQQIKQILLDKNRLLKRTRLKRSGFTILGKEKPDSKNNDVSQNEEENNDGSDYNEEIFDDDDFYHQLLRDFIERKTVGVSDSHALSRQWLEVQKLRNKARKKLVDRKASKARKIRYDVLPKLVNFMAPVEPSNPIDSRQELFKTLFGQTVKT